MNNEENFNQEAVNEYHDYQDHRAQAKRLLDKLKAKEAEGVAVSKVFWRNGQPTLVESTSKMQWDSRIQALGFGRPENPGLPATNVNPRKPAGWEAKRDRKNRRAYTLEETPVMNFKASGHLPAHYYMDESALEAYVESLTQENE
jgi:hypothetical protein